MSNIESLPEYLRRRIEVVSTGCWEWRGFRTSQGYGRIWSPPDKRNIGAHRAVYQFLIGPIKLQLDHLCRNRGCVNPSHLEDVSAKANILRGEGPAAKQARQKVCRRGHPLVGENLELYPRRDGPPHRRCVACRRARWRQRYGKGHPRTTRDVPEVQE